MSTIDTSTWNPDADLNTAIEGIPLNSDASIAQTWQVIRILMAAFKGDTSAIQALMVPFTGATASADGASGFVPAPEAGDEDKLLKGDGTWGTLSASDIPNIDASKIASGTIDLARIPAGAIERLVPVADQTARYALTTASVQLGDTVKQRDTGVMYLVVDTTKLGQAAGYVEYTAGSAASVPWSGVTDKPSTFTPSSHTHGSITNDGKLGTASRAVVTDGDKKIAVSDVTATELGYLTDVTANIQGQIDGKANDSSVVHKTGDETVAGNKTLTGLLHIARSTPFISFSHSDYTKGTNPTSGTKYSTLAFTDSGGTGNASRVGMVETYVATDGTTCTQIAAYKYEAGSTVFGAIGIKYGANGAYTYAPTPATTDSSSKIATTEFVKAQGYVANSGEQAINSLVVSPSGNLHKDADSGMLYVCGGTSTGGEGAYMILVGSTNNQGSPGCFLLRAATSMSNVKTFKGQPDGTLAWNGQAIQTSSDERLKTPVTDVPDEVLDAWEDVRWGQFRYLDAVERKGNSARLHLGLIAQRVKAVFEARGLDALAYGILCHDEEQGHWHDLDNGEEWPAVERRWEVDTPDLWTVRYAEAFAMEAACQRRRADRLEARIAALEERLNG